MASDAAPANPASSAPLVVAPADQAGAPRSAKRKLFPDEGEQPAADPLSLAAAAERSPLEQDYDRMGDERQVIRDLLSSRAEALSRDVLEEIEHRDYLLAKERAASAEAERVVRRQERQMQEMAEERELLLAGWKEALAQLDAFAGCVSEALVPLADKPEVFREAGSRQLLVGLIQEIKAVELLHRDGVRRARAHPRAAKK